MPMSQAELIERLRDLEAKVEAFEQEVETTFEERLEDFKALETRADEVLQQGYVFIGDVRPQARAAHATLSERREELQEILRRARLDLRREGYGATRAMKALGRGDEADPEDVEKANEEIEDLEAAYERHKTAVDALLEQPNEVYSALNARLNIYERYVRTAAEKGFAFEPGERLVMVDKAEWVQTGKSRQDPDGFLYLTDQRLIFEQNEKTGKTLGMFGGKEVQEVEWALPVAHITNVGAEDRGMLGGKDMLLLTLSPDAEVDAEQLTLEIKGGVESQRWQEWLGIVQGGELDEHAAT